MLRHISNAKSQDDNYLGQIPVTCTPTLLYDFKVKIKISTSILQGQHHSDMYESTLSMIAAQFAVNQEECRSLAPLIYAILKKVINVNLKQDWKLDKKQARQIWLYEESVKTSGHLDCESFSVPIPIYDEFSFNTTCKQDSFVLSYNAEIFFSPALSTAGVLYENMGFKYYIYKENEFDKELAKKIAEIIKPRKLIGINVDDNGALDLDDWYSFNEFHYNIRKTGKKYLIALHPTYPIDPFAEDSEEDSEANSDEIMSVDDYSGYEDYNDDCYDDIPIYWPLFFGIYWKLNEIA